MDIDMYFPSYSDPTIACHTKDMIICLYLPNLEGTRRGKLWLNNKIVINMANKTSFYIYSLCEMTTTKFCRKKYMAFE